MYRQLSQARREIRLLEIRSPSHPKDHKMSCLLHTVSLSDNPRFTALSYVWGDPSITESIDVNEQTVPVTTNLGAALRHAVFHWSSTFPSQSPSTFRLWADAICINQKDVGERNQQVRLMGSIYTSAELVLSWLGKDAEAALGIQTLDMIAEAVVDNPEEELNTLAWLEKYPSLQEDDLPGEGPGEYFRNKRWRAASAVFANVYFSRVWVFQEMALAAKLMLCIGIQSLDYTRLELAWSAIQSLRHAIQAGSVTRPKFVAYSVWNFLSENIMNWIQFERIQQARSKLETDQETEDDPDLSYGLILSLIGKEKRATDPRDHVYGLLEITRLHITVDYGKTIREVYRDYVYAILEGFARGCFNHEDHPLFFLNYAGIGLYNNEHGLSSWAPNFPAESQVRIAEQFIFSDSGRGVFPPGVPPPTLKEFSLWTSSVEVDSVSRVSEAPGRHTWIDGSMLRYIEDFISRHPTYKTGIPPLQALVRVLRVDKGTPTNDELIIYAFHLIRLLAWRDSENLDDHLSALGLAAGEDWDDFFVNMIFPEYKGLDIAWWYYLWVNPEDYVSELRPDIQRSVLVKKFQVSRRWRLFETVGGYLGLAPLHTKPGAILSVLHGSGTPVLLRKNELGQYELIGTCFALGLMHGEAAELVKAGKCVVDNIEIV
ncbi:hypothetical protein KC19_10G041500 [Ceratodon purpureus]|uniref:Heterokaryon incompatibility domain-containing protein n=1 Tax=Ceratodon purpureus TaxID=3225 RepID=A0A8T0GH04_CERPU|nr:hypothetical protein KC19_10G041500 [Ceratodon purpureus]